MRELDGSHMGTLYSHEEGDSVKRLVVLIVAAVLAILIGGSIAFAQEDEATPEDVEAAIADLTRAEIEAMGYVVDEECITAETVGAPAELGAMGFHAINEALIDDTLDPLEPEIILLDAEDNVIAVEYATPPQDEPLSVLGQQLAFVEGPDIDALHLWFMDNPAGQFADFNTNASCPEVVSIAATGTGGYLTSDGSGTLAGLALLLAITSAALVGAGWTLRRRTSH